MALPYETTRTMQRKQLLENFKKLKKAYLLAVHEYATTLDWDGAPDCAKWMFESQLGHLRWAFLDKAIQLLRELERVHSDYTPVMRQTHVSGLLNNPPCYVLDSEYDPRTGKFDSRHVDKLYRELHKSCKARLSFGDTKLYFNAPIEEYEI